MGARTLRRGAIPSSIDPAGPRPLERIEMRFRRVMSVPGSVPLAMIVLAVLGAAVALSVGWSPPPVLFGLVPLLIFVPEVMQRASEALLARRPGRLDEVEMRVRLDRAASAAALRLAADDPERFPEAGRLKARLSAPDVFWRTGLRARLEGAGPEGRWSAALAPREEALLREGLSRRDLARAALTLDRLDFEVPLERPSRHDLLAELMARSEDPG
jgi:hypothetical protein